MRIPLDSFEQHIEEKILERGLKYYERGSVDEPDELEPGYYEALVQGGENYTVGIRIQSGAITEHYCDCPYDMGPVCKHVVALIFHLQNDRIDLPVKTKGSKNGGKTKGASAKRPTVAEQMDKVLASVSHADLVAYVRTRCMEDASFRQHFLVTCMPEAIEQGHKDHLKQLRSALRAIAGRGGFIAYADAYAAGSVLGDVLDQARVVHHKGHPTRALPMITAVIEAGAEAMQGADDSNGDLGGAISEAFAFLAEMANEKHEESFRGTLLTAVRRLLSDEAVLNCDWNGELLPTAATLVSSAEEAAPLMATLRKAAHDDFGGSSARDALLDLTRRFQGKAAAAELEEDFLVHTDVRERAIEAALKAKDWTRAKDLAEKGRRVMRNGRPATYDHYWTHHLLRIAQLMKDGDEVLRLNRVLLLEDGREGMKHYKDLKRSVPAAEWPAYVEDLIAALRAKHKGADSDLIVQICVAEERWDEVMAAVRAAPHVASPFHTTLEQYEQELTKRYPAEVATILAERAEAFASTDGPKRDDYVQAVRLLRRVIKAGDRQLADALAADWRVRLARRKGLIEELGKL